MNSSSLQCNICGGSNFVPGHNGRLSSAKTNPICGECGTVERQRIIYKIFSSFPKEWFNNSSLLQTSADKSIDITWFKTHEVVSLSGQGCVNIKPIDRKYQNYDWISSNHILQLFVNDKQALQELLRVLHPSGVLQLCLPSPATIEKTKDWGYPNPTIANHCRIYGRDLFDRFGSILHGYSVYSIAEEDPGTGASDIIYFITRNEEVIKHLKTNKRFTKINLSNSNQAKKLATAGTGSETTCLNFRHKDTMKVFTFWQTPSTLKRIPPYVLLSLARSRKALGDKFCILTNQNITEYVKHLPPKKEWKFSTSSNVLSAELMGIVAKSDYIRMRAVYENGGMWIDADSVILQNFAPILDTFTSKLTWHSEAFFGSLPGNEILRRVSENMLLAHLQKWGNPGGLKDLIPHNHDIITHINWKELLDPGYTPAYNYKGYDVMTRTDLCPTDFLINDKQVLLKLYNSGFMKYEFATQTVDDFLNGESLLCKIFLLLNPDKSWWIEQTNQLNDLLMFKAQ